MIKPLNWHTSIIMGMLLCVVVCWVFTGWTALSNKKCMACLGAAPLFCGGAGTHWIIPSKQEFWQTCFTLARTRTPRSIVIHRRSHCWCLKDPTSPPMRPAPCFRHTDAHWRCSVNPLQLPWEKKTKNTANTEGWKSHTLSQWRSRWEQHPQPWHRFLPTSVTCGSSQRAKKRDAGVTFPQTPPAPLPSAPRVDGDLIKTTFTRLPSSHDFHPSVCSRSVMKPVNNVW